MADARGRVILRALGRGLRRRCPHCGRGPLFSGFAHHLERCRVCGLVYERNPGDTWAFTIIGDRLPIAAIVALIYFGRWITEIVVPTLKGGNFDQLYDLHQVRYLDTTSVCLAIAFAWVAVGVFRWARRHSHAA